VQKIQRSLVTFKLQPFADFEASRTQRVSANISPDVETLHLNFDLQVKCLFSVHINIVCVMYFLSTINGSFKFIVLKHVQDTQNLL